MALSNKDFIGETLERGVDKRVAGTLAATAWAAARGVAAFRVHEVAETFDVLQMTAAIMGDVAPLNTIRGLREQRKRGDSCAQRSSNRGQSRGGGPR